MKPLYSYIIKQAKSYLQLFLQLLVLFSQAFGGLFVLWPVATDRRSLAVGQLAAPRKSLSHFLHGLLIVDNLLLMLDAQLTQPLHLKHCVNGKQKKNVWIYAKKKNTGWRTSKTCMKNAELIKHDYQCVCHNDVYWIQSSVREKEQKKKSSNPPVHEERCVPDWLFFAWHSFNLWQRRRTSAFGDGPDGQCLAGERGERSELRSGVAKDLIGERLPLSGLQS